jgi:hypothetical protein
MALSWAAMFSAVFWACSAESDNNLDLHSSGNIPEWAGPGGRLSGHVWHPLGFDRRYNLFLFQHQLN